MKKSKILFLLFMCVLLLTGCAGAGKTTNASLDYYNQEKDGMNTRLDDGTESGLEKIYNKTMQQIEDNDYEELEGKNAFDKMFRVLYGGVYRTYVGLRSMGVYLFVIGEFVGAVMFKFCTQNKRLKRYGIGLMIMTAIVTILIYLGGGYLNQAFLG